MDRLVSLQDLFPEGTIGLILVKDLQLSAINFRNIYSFTCMSWGGGHAIAQLVDALCYKPEGRGFDSG
jgi:hypothetical protein